MNLKHVDIILPNYNKGLYLDEAINSVIDQSYQNWKLIIIDDHSTDNSIKILSKYKNHKNIKILELKKNMGPSFCRNLGIRISSSDYIAFLDSDDYWKKEKLQKQINFMVQNNYHFTFTDYSSFFQIGEDKKSIPDYKLPSVFDLKKFTFNSSINTSTMIISRSILKNLKFKKIKKLEDYLFKCQLLSKNIKAYKLGYNAAFYRILRKSRSSERIKNIFYLWKINSKYLEYEMITNFLSIISISINSIKKYGVK